MSDKMTNSKMIHHEVTDRAEPVCGQNIAAKGVYCAVNYTYILRCSDNTFYTGWTNHLEERIKAHNEGRGAKYTRGRGPVELIYYETFKTKQEAMSREFAIKQMTRREKELLIQEFNIEESGLKKGEERE